MNTISRNLIISLLAMGWLNSAIAAEWVIGFDGLGPITIGMTTTQVIKAKGNLNPSLDGDKLDTKVNHCVGVYFPDQFVYLQLEKGRLEEIQVTSSKFKTADGIGIGSTFADIQKVFNKKNLQIGTNHYSEDVPQVTIGAPESIKSIHPNMSVGIQVEFEVGPLVGTSRITSISIGAHYVEGCA